MAEKVASVSELSETRIWKVLDKIADRLTSIESQLSDIVRLEERMNNHENAISRYGQRLDHHDSRLRETELWQANHGDRSSSERLISNIQEEVSGVTKRVGLLEHNKDITTGQKDVGKEVLKWTAGILASILMWVLTKG